MVFTLYHGSNVVVSEPRLIPPNRIKEPADVFWFMNESRLMYIWDTYGKTGSSVEYLTKTMEGLCLKYERKD